MGNFFLSATRSFLFNFILLSFLIIGIQNSNKKNQVNFLEAKSINMPVSFIAGTNFIIGSIFGNIIFSFLELKKDESN